MDSMGWDEHHYKKTPFKALARAVGKRIARYDYMPPSNPDEHELPPAYQVLGLISPLR